jgi:hypothetical protein
MPHYKNTVRLVTEACIEDYVDSNWLKASPVFTNTHKTCTTIKYCNVYLGKKSKEQLRGDIRKAFPGQKVSIRTNTDKDVSYKGTLITVYN